MRNLPLDHALSLPLYQSIFKPPLQYSHHKRKLTSSRQIPYFQYKTVWAVEVTQISLWTRFYSKSLYILSHIHIYEVWFMIVTAIAITMQKKMCLFKKYRRKMFSVDQENCNKIYNSIIWSLYLIAFEILTKKWNYSTILFDFIHELYCKIFHSAIAK